MNNMHLRVGSRLSGPRHQQGAAAVFVAIVLVALVGIIVVGIDIGRLYYAQRSLQRDANLAALDGARALGGCNNGGEVGTSAQITSAVQNSLTTNLARGGPGDPGYGSPLSLLTGVNGAPAVQIGTTTTQGSTRIFVPGSVDDPGVDSVRVNLSAPMPPALLPGLFPHGGILSASATARQPPPQGGFSVGTTLASVDSSQSALLNPLLTALLGSNTKIALSAVDYNGIAQTQVSLANLMVAANVTNLHDLLALRTDLPGALQILGNALHNVGGGTSQLAAGLVSGLAGQAASNGDLTPFGDLFANLGTALNPTVTDVLSAVPIVNGLQLLQALGMDAARNQPIKVPLALNIPGLVQLGLYLTVLQPPQFYFGSIGGSATSAQVKLNVYLGIGDPQNLLGALVGGLVANAHLGLQLKVADAKGTLDSLSCPTLDQPQPSATVGVNTNVAYLSLGSYDSRSDLQQLAAQNDGGLSAGTLIGALLGILKVNLDSDVADVQVGSSLSDQAGPFQNFVLPPDMSTPGLRIYKAVQPDNSTPNPQTIGSGSLLSSTVTTAVQSLTAKNNLDVRLLGLPLGKLLDPVVAAVGQIVLTPVTALLDKILDPLLTLLGVQVGAATIDYQQVVVGAPPTLVSTRLPAKPATP